MEGITIHQLLCFDAVVTEGGADSDEVARV